MLAAYRQTCSRPGSVEGDSGPGLHGPGLMQSRLPCIAVTEENSQERDRPGNAPKGERVPISLLSFLVSATLIRR